MTIKITKRESVFIPIKDITRKQVADFKERLTFHFYGKEKICEECDWRADRPCDVCQNCANFNGSIFMASQVKVGDGKYLKIPIGSSEKTLAAVLPYTEYKLVDKSPTTKIKPIKFTGTLREEQTVAVNTLARLKRGGLSAPPRSGKTVMGSALVCKLGLKTLIIASQRDWLIGFQETFIGSKTQAPLTDLVKNRIKICKTLKDFQDTDVCLATVQTFYSEGGQVLLRKIRDMFPVIIADEVHTAAATKYAQILSKLNSQYTLGLSGTHDRKDGRYLIVDHILGPVIHELKTERLRPNIRLTRTGYAKAYKGQVMWARMVSSLENDKKRIDVIAKQAIKDVAAGHMILIPVAQVKPIAKIVARINELAGRKLAYPFTGSLSKANRDLYIEKAREYKIKVLVGTQKILSVGINIPRASCLYETVLSSNIPNATQRIARVLTPQDGKVAIVRYFLDDMGVRKNCIRNEWFNVMVPVFKPIISERDKEMLNAYFRGKVHEKVEF